MTSVTQAPNDAAERADATARAWSEIDSLLDELPTMPETERGQARAEVIRRCQPWARSAAARYRRAGEPFEDLAQVAVLGLILAVDRFDSTRGVSFRHFALPTITGEIKKHFRDKGWSVRVGRRVQELYQDVHRAEPLLAQRLARTPNERDLAEYLGVPEASICAARQGEVAYRARSLSRPAPGDGDVADTIGEPDPAIEAVAERDALHRAWATLPQRLQTVLSLRFVDELTQSQIADKMGLSQMHVSRLLFRSLTALRAHMETETPTEQLCPSR